MQSLNPASYPLYRKMIKDVKQTRTHRSAKIPQKVLEKHNIHLKKILSGFELRKKY